MRMRNWKLLICSLVASVVVAAQAGAAQINEIRIDQPGGDDSEYFELFGNAGESLDNLWYVVLGDTGGGNDGANGFGDSGIVEAAVDLTGLSIPADRTFLAVESSFENGVGEAFEGVTPDLVDSFSFENSDNVTHLLVANFTGAVNDDLDTDDDGALNATPWSAVVDAIGLIETTLPPADSGEDWAYGAALGFSDIGPDGSFVPGQVFRKPNGGAFQIGAFSLGLTDTPGTSNIPEPSAVLLALFGLCAVGVVGLRARWG